MVHTHTHTLVDEAFELRPPCERLVLHDLRKIPFTISQALSSCLNIHFMYIRKNRKLAVEQDLCRLVEKVTKILCQNESRI